MNRGVHVRKKDMVFLAMGKRSVVYTMQLGRKVVVMKQEKKGIGARERLENEAKFLKIVNKQGIGPRLLGQGKGYILCEWVQGTLIEEYIRTAKNVWPVLVKILEQCFVLDQLGINKLEMHHPVKHIFITKKGPVMIDFERCYQTKRPKNVTQFFQFLFVLGIVRQNPAVLAALRAYKADLSEKALRFLVRVARAS